MSKYFLCFVCLYSKSYILVASSEMIARQSKTIAASSSVSIVSVSDMSPSEDVLSLTQFALKESITLTQGLTLFWLDLPWLHINEGREQKGSPFLKSD